MDFSNPVYPHLSMRKRARATLSKKKGSARKSGSHGIFQSGWLSRDPFFMAEPFFRTRSRAFFSMRGVDTQSYLIHISHCFFSSLNVITRLMAGYVTIKKNKKKKHWGCGYEISSVSYPHRSLLFSSLNVNTRFMAGYVTIKKNKRKSIFYILKRSILIWNDGKPRKGWWLDCMRQREISFPSASYKLSTRWLIGAAPSFQIHFALFLKDYLRRTLWPLRI